MQMGTHNIYRHNSRHQIAAFLPEKNREPLFSSRSIFSPLPALPRPHTQQRPPFYTNIFFRNHTSAMAFYKFVSSVSKTKAIGASFAASAGATVVLYSFLQSTGL